jgi:hypothetical protein
VAKKEAELVDGTVESSEITVDDTDKTVMKVMRTKTITRVPGGRIALITLDTRSGPVDLTIDEATARALAKVFDDAPNPWEKD